MTALQTSRQGRKFAQVVEGAVTVFLREGYAGASVDDIAQAARVSKATLYSYFPDKAQMFAAAMRAETARLHASFSLDVAPGLPPEAGVPQIMGAIADWLADPARIRLCRIHVSEASRFPDLAAQFHAALHDLLQGQVRPHLDRWAAAGALDLDDSAAAAAELILLARTGWPDALLLGPPQPAGRARLRTGADRAAGLFLAAHAPVRAHGPRRLMQS